MAKKKQKEIPQSWYYDGRKKGALRWKEDNFKRPDAPTVENVKKWIDEWNKTEGYPEQESALNKLFIDLCPFNESLDDILIKACTLNDFYSTNIYKIIDVAKEILNMNLDKRLQKGTLDSAIVMELNDSVKKKTGRSIYSFATKYCSHHVPEEYPIYDSYVDMLLRYYRDTVNTPDFSFEDKELLDYRRLCEIEDSFKRCFGLEMFNAKEIDKFLWQVGKITFPKWKTVDSESIIEGEE